MKPHEKPQELSVYSVVTAFPSLSSVVQLPGTHRFSLLYSGMEKVHKGECPLSCVSKYLRTTR